MNINIKFESKDIDWNIVSSLLEAAGLNRLMKTGMAKFVNADRMKERGFTE